MRRNFEPLYYARYITLPEVTGESGWYGNREGNRIIVDNCIFVV